MKCIFLFVLIKVSSDCGTCATLKFKQSHQIDGLGPAKLTVYPTLASIRSKEAYKQIFHIKSFNTTQFGQPNMLENTGTITILVCIYPYQYQVAVFLPFSVADSQVVSMWPLVNLCPCHFECNSTTTTEIDVSTTTSIPISTTSLLIKNTTEYSSTSVSGKHNTSTENSSEASIASYSATASTKSEKTTETSKSSSTATVQSSTGMYSTVVLRCI